MLGEAMDPTIKLFGKTIPLPEFQQTERSSCSPNRFKNIDTDKEKQERQGYDQEGDGNDDDQQSDKELKEGNLRARTPGHGPDHDRQSAALTEDMTLVSGNGESPKMRPVDKENFAPNNSKTEEKQIDNGGKQDQKTTLKKPDKILPCPRCNSVETKFCYYNNYNVNQPRHFCKNCHRYWTAGGTMRNVPVGAGRRKSKTSSASFNNQCHQLAATEALQSASPNVLGGFHCPAQRPEGAGRMHMFGPHLCESVSSMLNLNENTMISHGFHKPDEAVVSTPCADLGISGKTSPTGHGVMTPLGPQSQISCFPGAPWPYPWGSPFPPPPALCPPLGFPMPMYPIAAVPVPAPYWGCSVPSNCVVPCVLPQPPSPNMTAGTSPSTGQNSPTLGKHSREESVLKPNDFEEDEERTSSERGLWIPKTLRIDDPREAAKSSMWATLGFNKNDKKTKSDKAKTLFKAFQPKVKDKNRIAEASPVLQANPAALSRSLNFQEGS